MLYGKIKNGVVELAPSSIVIPDSGITYYPGSDVYTDFGYKEIVETERPQVSEYFNLIDFFEDTEDTIEKRYRVEMKPIEEIKSIKCKNLMDYDSSDSVNQFFYKGTPLWFSKDERKDILQSFLSEESLGIQSSFLADSKTGFYVEIMVDEGISILRQLEVYGKSLYRQTFLHLKNIENQCDEQEIIDYDFTLGYPDKLSF